MDPRMYAQYTSRHVSLYIYLFIHTEKYVDSVFVCACVCVCVRTRKEHLDFYQ